MIIPKKNSTDAVCLRTLIQDRVITSVGRKK